MVYSNFFTSFTDATQNIVNDCNLDAFSNKRWLARLEEFNEIVLKYSNLNYENKLPRSSCLPLFLCANNNITKILDLGGGGRDGLEFTSKNCTILLNHMTLLKLNLLKIIFERLFEILASITFKLFRQNSMIFCIQIRAFNICQVQLLC